MLWDIPAPTFAHLDTDICCDVLVIGGGMAGILCAHFLTQKGFDTVLVEGGVIGGGVTRKTTAVITAQHDTLYSQLIQQNGKQAAQHYLDANLWAVQEFRNLSKTIACDFEDKPSVMYTKEDTAKMQAEQAALATLGFAADFISTSPLPFTMKGAVRFPNMGQLHPIKLLYGIAKGLRIYENTFITQINKQTAQTRDGHRITANAIVVATHFPFINRSGLYFMKQYQMRSYVLALENACTLDGTYVDEGEGLYFRNYGPYLLVGGGDRRTGKGCGFAMLRAFAKQYYPNAKEAFAFATQDCMSLDGMPYIGPYGKLLPHTFVATGFNEWGMTTSMLAAKILCDTISGEENEWASTFRPQRSMLHKQLFVNLGETLVSFAKPTAKRCSHLGCALTYNPQEGSYDCACHGSRFAQDGTVLENPAMRNGHV